MNAHGRRLDWLVLILFLSLLAGCVGYLLRGWRAPSGVQKPAPSPAAPRPSESETQWWTCSMHPRIRQPKPGNCPICGMKLIPVAKASGEEQASLRELVLSDSAKRLARIETSPVERKFVTAEIRMLGKVEYDETRLKYITAWVPGRLDRLYVDSTGVPVRKGEHLVDLYSPELISAQEELIQATKTLDEIQKSDVEIMKETTRATVEAVREKLRLWGLTQEQISEIVKSGKVSTHLTIYAPIGGVVVNKDALEGMYVETGSRIYTVADLSRVWIRLDAYESDLEWIRYGQRVECTSDAYPGQVFLGRISFIDPLLNTETRTVKLRVDAENPEGKLKPGMFVHALVRSQVAGSGRVMDPDMAGKWVCTMHPEVARAQAGNCEVCGMALVRAESLGYVSAEPKEAPLVIPASAALVTGKRAVVYVEVPDRPQPTYEGREVALGPRAGDYYLVYSNLKEGERVVTRGNFRIDSSVQILAKPSMMSPEGGGAGGMHPHGGEAPGTPSSGAPSQTEELPAAFKGQLDQVEASYRNVSAAMKTADLTQIRAAFVSVGEALSRVDTNRVSGHARLMWKELSMLMTNDSVEGRNIKDLTEAQRVFANLTNNMHRIEEHFGLALPKPGAIVETPPLEQNRPAGGHPHE